MTKPKKSAQSRKALVSLRVPIEGRELRAYRSWSRRAETAGGPLGPLTEFAPWYPVARGKWIDAASELGQWHSSTREPFGSGSSCRAEDPDRVLGHLGDTDGTVVHLTVDENEGGVFVRAAYCRTGLADDVLDHVWTREQRLTYEELVAGISCRGCGRPFFGGLAPVPAIHRDPEQQAAAEAEEADFLARHPECRAMRWSISGGYIQHCARCCPPPPMDPSTRQEASRILARLLVDHRNKRQQLAKRWDETAAGDAAGPQQRDRAGKAGRLRSR